MNRLHTLTTFSLATLLSATLLVACAGTDTATRLDGRAPFYTSIADARAAAAEGQLIAVDFYTDW